MTYGRLQLQLAEHHPIEQGLRPYLNLYNQEFHELLAEHHPIEQGLRLCDWQIVSKQLVALAEHHPIEQGLRRPSHSSVILVETSRRASSNRTRIKTVRLAVVKLTREPARRASSNRTRIKTRAIMLGARNEYSLAEHHPIEQGLRLYYTCLYCSDCKPRRASSNRTRIKTPLSPFLSPFLLSRRASSNRTRIKTFIAFGLDDELCHLAEHHPIEQGLRR